MGSVRQVFDHDSVKINKPYYATYPLIIHFGISLEQIQSKKKKENGGMQGTKKIPDQVIFSAACSAWYMCPQWKYSVLGN